MVLVKSTLILCHTPFKLFRFIHCYCFFIFDILLLFPGNVSIGIDGTLSVTSEYTAHMVVACMQ